MKEVEIDVEIVTRTTIKKTVVVRDPDDWDEITDKIENLDWDVIVANTPPDKVTWDWEYS